MKPLSLGSLAAVALLGGVLGAGVNAGLLAAGEFPLLITPYVGLLSVGTALGLYLAGRHVRDLRDGKETPLHPVLALRIVLFARASAVVCAALAGVCAGVVATNIPRIEAVAVTDSAIGAGVAGVGLLVWMSVGILVEKWGQRRDDDGQTPA